MTIYDDIAAAVPGIFEVVKQGTLLIRRRTTTFTSDVGAAPTEGTVNIPIEGVVTRVRARYSGGQLVVREHDRVVFRVPTGETPSLGSSAGLVSITDSIVVDGEERAMEGLRPVPGAGASIVWIAMLVS